MELQTTPFFYEHRGIGVADKNTEGRGIEIKFTFTDNDLVGKKTLSGQTLEEFSRLFTNPVRKENYYVLAISNLLKKVDFLQLSLQHCSQLLTDEEFEKELDINSIRYTIELNQIPTSDDINAICEIARKINRDCSADEICEMFSISPNCLEPKLLEYKEDLYK